MLILLKSFSPGIHLDRIGVWVKATSGLFAGELVASAQSSDLDLVTVGIVRRALEFVDSQVSHTVQGLPRQLPDGHVAAFVPEKSRTIRRIRVQEFGRFQF